MRHIALEDNVVAGRRLPFFLALEEWVARRMPAGDYFFSWQVDPTVICGRNQEIDKEVNLKYCADNGIDVVRRRSGGGAVFADRENFMFSYITDGDNVVEEFARYTNMIADALRRLGIDAEATGRNDITIGGKKVAGNAFYHLPGRCIAHGTMLYHFDPHHLANALTPSKAKLESKGVKSVPMRVTCLQNEGISLSPADFQQYIIENITDGEPYLLTADEVREVEHIEQGYYDPAFLRINGRQKGEEMREGERNAGGHVSRTTHIAGLGEFSIDYRIEPASREIRDFSISGDFFMSEDVETLLCQRLDGVKAQRETIAARLAEIDVEGIVPGLTAQQLLEIIA